MTVSAFCKQYIYIYSRNNVHFHFNILIFMSNKNSLKIWKFLLSTTGFNVMQISTRTRMQTAISWPKCHQCKAAPECVWLCDGWCVLDNHLLTIPMNYKYLVTAAQPRWVILTNPHPSHHSAIELCMRTSFSCFFGAFVSYRYKMIHVHVLCNIYSSESILYFNWNNSSIITIKHQINIEVIYLITNTIKHL